MRGKRSRWFQVIAGLATFTLVSLVAFQFQGRATRAARMQDPSTPPIEGAPPKNSSDLPPAEPDQPPPPTPDTLKAEAPPAEVAAPTPDPDQDAEAFVTRTRKEANDRLIALEKEASDLRLRLSKVEAATARIRRAFPDLDRPNDGSEPQLEPIRDNNAEPPHLSKPVRKGEASPLPDDFAPPTNPKDTPKNQ